VWHLGALSLAFGGYWFWFVIRVDVSAEGQVWYRLTQGDIFIVSMLAMVTFGLLWSFTMGSGALDTLFFVLFILSSTTLFSTVLWSKFAHMFFKPAAAYPKEDHQGRRFAGEPARRAGAVRVRDQDTLPGHSRVHGRQSGVHGTGYQARAAPTLLITQSQKVRRI
jgi:hypothetical protein